MDRTKIDFGLNQLPQSLILVVLLYAIGTYKELYYAIRTFPFRTNENIIDRAIFARLLFNFSNTIPLKINNTFKRPPIRFAKKDGLCGFYHSILQITKMVITQNINKNVPIGCFNPLSLTMINSRLAYGPNAPIRNMHLDSCVEIVLKFIDVKIYEILFLHLLNKNKLKYVSIINNMNRIFDMMLLNGFTKIIQLDISTTLIANPEVCSQLVDLHIIKVNCDNIFVVSLLLNNLSKIFIKVVGERINNYTGNIIHALSNFKEKNIYATIECHISNRLVEFAKSNNNLRFIRL